MDRTLRTFVDSLYAQNQAHDSAQPDRLQRYRNLEPESAELLAILATAVGPRRMLELGTSNGFSTLFLADVARDLGAELVSVDTDAERTAAAAANLAAAGLGSTADLRTEDAAAVLASSPDRCWDLIFLDAERPAYPSYWPDLVRSLAPHGVLVVDNVLSHADQVREFRTLVSADTRVRATVVPIGAGLLLVVMTPTSDSVAA